MRHSFKAVRRRPLPWRGNKSYHGSWHREEHQMIQAARDRADAAEAELIRSKEKGE